MAKETSPAPILYLTRDMILGARDITTEEVEVPEWGGTVVVTGMTGSERDAFEASLLEHKKSGGSTLKLQNLRAKLVSKTVIDPATKQPMFTVGDIEVLGAKSAAALDRIFTVAQRLSGISKEDIEEMEKN